MNSRASTCQALPAAAAAGSDLLPVDVNASTRDSLLGLNYEEPPRAT